MIRHLSDLFRRQRAQQLVNLGRVAVVGAGEGCEASLRGAVDPDMPVHVLRGAFIAGEPAVMCRMLAPPFDVVEEAVSYHGRHGMVKRFLREDLRAARARPLGDAMCLAVNLSPNYHHWLLENLPKAVLAEEVGFTGVYLVPPRPFARQSLELLGISGDRIVEHRRGDLWRAERLFVTAPLNFETNLRRPRLLARLRAALLAALPKLTGGGRLYVSRNRPGGTRGVINEPELKALLGRFGFAEFFCEDHPIADQLAAFAGAEAAIGSDGAGFANTLVMPERALLVALFSPLRVDLGGTLVPVRLNRLRYYTVFAPTLPEGGYPHGDRVVANLELIEATLEREFG